jgi:N-formylglutamate deformylase
MKTFTLHPGTAPLLVSLPHNGTQLPDDITARLTDDARRVPDTDWHVSRLYEFAKQMGASILTPVYSRYAVDLNRPEDDVSLYPGKNTTGLCPTKMFSGATVYRTGQEPTEVEIRQRINDYWRPYHSALREELDRIRAKHGRAVLWDGHSIRSEVPFLFDGRLPDFNLGTANGASCSPQLQQRLHDVLQAQSDYSFILNGRFKGGHITRHYGNPLNGTDAIQLELAQVTYMDEDSFEYLPERVQKVQAVIRRLLETTLA